MKVRITLLTENNFPRAALGPNPEAAVRKGWEFMLKLLEMESTNGDKGQVEKVEILED